MERKLWLCLDCHAVFYDGENHICKTVDKSRFILKPWVGNKNAEGIHGSISNVRYNSVGQRELLNYPAAFSNSKNVEMPLLSENLKNDSEDANSYVKVQRGENRISSTSEQKETLDSSLQPSHISTLRGNAENRIAYDWMSYVPSHSPETREKTINYFTMPIFSAPSHELKKFSGESSIATSMIPHYALTQVLYEQECLNRSSFSGGTSSKETFAITGESNRNLPPNNNSSEPESHEGMDKGSILRSINILEAYRNSKRLNLVPMQTDVNENKASHLPTLLQVNSLTCDIRKTNFVDNDAPLVSENDEYPIADPSHSNGETDFQLKDGFFVCKICGKSYITKPRFVVHYRLHSGERPFACDKCPERFSQKIQLSRHYKKHFDKEPYPCDICERSFFTKTDLDKHREIHSFERPHACDKCTKRFKEKEALKCHLLTHTKPFSCIECGKTFASKNSLNNHLLTHVRN